MRIVHLLSLIPALALAAACGGSGSDSSILAVGDASTGAGADGSSSGNPASDGSSSGDGGVASDDGGVNGGGEGGTTLYDAGACGLCPTGFTCRDVDAGSSYCVSPHGVPAFDHVLLIVMENTSQSDLASNSQAPYINQLLGTYAYTTNYSTSYHPSLPNYLDITSGTDHGVACDCAPGGTPSCTSFNCGLGGLLASCNCPVGSAHLGDQLDGAHVEWREYGEGMGTPCNGTPAAPYAPKHLPFLYYDDVYTDAARCQQRVRDYGDFAGDLAAGTYRFAMISPNLCNDMHGDPSCPSSPSETTQGDTWLSTEVPKILASPGFGPGGRDVLFLVWDEQTGSTGTSATPMLNIIVSPLAKKGPTSKAYTHESLLATIEDSFGLSRLNNAATVPSPIDDVWK
jgi:hypothetical protein